MKEKNSNLEFAGDVLTIASGTIISQIIAALAIPIVTRIYSAESYGTYSLFVSIITIIGSVATLKYELSIALPEKDEEAVNQLYLSIIISFLFSFILFMLLLIFKSLLLKFFDQALISFLLFLLPLSFFVIGVNYSLNYWNTRKRNFLNISINKISKEAIKDAFQLIPVLFGMVNGVFLIYSEFLGWLISTLIFYKNSLSQITRKFSEKIVINKNDLVAGFKKYIKFPKYSAFTVFINNFAIQTPIFLISLYYSKAYAGEFAISNNILRIPLTFIGNSIGQVFYQRASNVRRDSKKIKSLVRETTLNLLYFGAFPTLFLAFFGKESLILLLGKKWEIAGSITQILSPWLLFNFISVPISTLVGLFEKQEFGLIFNIILIITKFLSIYIGFIMNDFFLGMVLFSISGSLLYFAFSLLLCSIVGLSPWAFLQDIIKLVIKTLPFIFLLIIVKILNINEYLKLGLAMFFTIISFVIYLRDNKLISDLFLNSKFMQKIFPKKEK
ncbi:MAG: oligosaccharide flippase family protein [Pelolinea sp.]|nr:oligosaccharide flippase family protein [Pelolinea sp.]